MYISFFYIVLFFFKQKTAYEMRISDWSSDVCSSDLLWIGRQVFRKIKVFQQPRLHDVVEQNPVEVAAAAHGDATVCEKCHTAGNALCNCDVERSTAEVVDNKYTVVLSLPHDAHHGGDRFLHQGHTHEPSRITGRSEEHTSELQSLMRITYAVFCLKKKKQKKNTQT